MARDGKMGFTSTTVGGDALILNRAEFEGVALTIDFTGNSDGVVKAGTPINKNGAAVTATPWTGAIGVLLDDVYAERPQGTVLKEAYINVTRANAHSGLTLDAALATEVAKSGGRLVLESPITV